VVVQLRVRCLSDRTKLWVVHQDVVGRFTAREAHSAMNNQVEQDGVALARSGVVGGATAMEVPALCPAGGKEQSASNDMIS
jgi:hypothetical protein